MLTATEAAAYLSLSPSTLAKWRCYGSGPVFQKLGKAVRYQRSALDAFMAENEKASTSDYVA
ncbi:MAG: helix-turn-helix domain-containing protein [Pseudomonadota bacterium]